MSRIRKSIVPEGQDEVLEMAAQAIEGDSFLDLCGVASRKKRDREDANLRMEAAKAERRRNAETIRALKGKRDSDAVEMLAVLADLPDTRQHMAYLVDAWPLAWKGWVQIEATLVCNSNQIPPQSDYRIRLTDKGRHILAESRRQATVSPTTEDGSDGN